MFTTHRTRVLACAAATGAVLLATASAPALADAGHGGAIGKPGAAAAAARTVEITLQDNTFQPESVAVKPGETIRFVLKNKGELLHEFNIGTPQMHAAHQKEMAQMMEHGMLTPTGINQQTMHMDHGKAGMPAMKHDDPNSALVEPGKTKELTWTFPKGGTLEFACNIPGHYESGMVGKITMGPMGGH